MGATRDVYTERAGCPLYTASAVIDGRWKPMIFQRVSARPLGFAELRRAMPRVTTKVLRQQLRQMIADDLIVCERLSPPRLGVRYRVTKYGHSLGPLFTVLWRWGAIHLRRAGAAGGTIAASPAARDRHQA
jgi:DNA-binding HxlR family transcriptional regulator